MNLAYKVIRAILPRLVLAAIVWAAFVGFQKAVELAERNEMERIHPELRAARLRVEAWEDEEAARRKQFAADLRAGKVVSSPTNSWRKMSLSWSDMSNDQKTNFVNLFAKKFQPALEHWGAAYSNRIPFDLGEVTLDKFNSTLGSHMFTFMIGNTTLTFVESKDLTAPAKVGYLMVKQAALDMNHLPGKDFAPNFNSPVTVEEVIQMVKADCGVEFKPDEVIIRPTAKATALNGGVFVDILPQGADPNNALNYKISMVFDANGKLVNYEQDPSWKN